MAKVVFHDFSLGFAEPDLSAQVAQMKAKGVQMVFTCMDRDETLVLAKEMKKQKLNAIQELPNGYDAAFIKANAQYYEGSYVVPQFTALEWKPQMPEIKLFEKWIAGREQADLRDHGDRLDRGVPVRARVSSSPVPSSRRRR